MTTAPSAQPIITDTARVYTDYPTESPPEHPGSLWTRWVCISDTHSKTFDVPPGDALIHAGDLMQWGAIDQLQVTIDWINSLPHPFKFVIAGNHDELLDSSREDYYDDKARPTKFQQPAALFKLFPWPRARVDRSKKSLALAQQLVLGPEARDAGLVYLEYQTATLATSSGAPPWSIFGSPASPRYGTGAFQYPTYKATEINDRIPDDIDILITHGPPKHTLDRTRRGKSAGCSALAQRLATSLPNCRLHVFGHIHEARGAVLVHRLVGEEIEEGDVIYRKEVLTVCVNAAGRGTAGTQPIIVDLLKPATSEGVDQVIDALEKTVI